jgi:peptidoglycan biosynthesis protein MviN/MurJ (putative lipid II flippase)
MSRWLIIAGIALLITGIIIHFAPWLINWFGKLPGDINIQNERSRIFIPITSMIVISLVFTVLLNIFNRW